MSLCFICRYVHLISILILFEMSHVPSGGTARHEAGADGGRWRNDMYEDTSGTRREKTHEVSTTVSLNNQNTIDSPCRQKNKTVLSLQHLSQLTFVMYF